MVPLELTPHHVPFERKIALGFGKLDALRDQATAGYSRMEDKVRENSDILAAARQARPMLQPFLS